MTLTSAVSEARPRVFDPRKRRDVLERAWSPPAAERPAAGVPRENPADIPGDRLPDSDDAPAPAGIPECSPGRHEPAGGSALGVGSTSAEPGPGQTGGAGPGARGVRGPGRGGPSTAGGGGAETENAIETALRWLARHQNADGSWLLTPSWRRAPRAWGANMGRSPGDAVGTGLALLAFSGAGCGESSGEYRKTVACGLAWLRRWQKDKVPPFCEPHTAGIVALALAEAAQLSGNGATAKAAQTAADRVLDYYCRGTSRRFLLSEAVWAAMAVEAAAKAGLKVKKLGKTCLLEVLAGCRRESGAFGYKVLAAEGRLKPEGTAGFSYATAGGAAAMLCLGGSPRSGRISRSADLALRKAGEAHRVHGIGDFLMLQHGSVAMRRMGGEHFEEWRKVAVEPALARQIKEGPDAGAWPAKMTNYLWAGDRPGGANVFATALGAMILESGLGPRPSRR